MKRKKDPTVFGKRAILMMGYDGRLRIIYPNGHVEYSDELHCGEFGGGCTSREDQRAAYIACVERDANYSSFHSGKNFSTFLGYL